MADGYLNFDTKINTAGFNVGLKAIGTIAVGALTGITTALGGAATYAAKVGSDFEAGMSKVSAISGASGMALDALTEKAKEMGSKTKFSATEAASAMEYMAMAGWKTEDMLSGIEGIMNLAAASGEDLATTSDIVTDALTAFGLSAKDSTRFADVLAAASSNANTNVSLMGETFKYVAPIAGAMGYSAEDCAVAIGLMANSGIKASQAGTALRSMLSRMAKPTDEVETAMSKLGVSLTDSAGNMKSLDEVMGDLRTGFSGLSESEKVQTATALAGQEAMSGLLAIVSASDEDFDKLKASINNCDGAAADMATTMQDNLQGSITILKSALEGLGIEIYESMKEPLKDAAEMCTEYVNQLTEAFKSGGTSKLVEVGGNILTNVLVGITKQMPEVISLATGVIQSVVDSLNSNLPQIISAGGDILRSLYDGAVAILPSVCSLGYNIVASLASEIASYAPVLIQDGINLLSQLGAGLQEAIPEFLANALPILASFSESLLENVGLLVDAGIQFVYNIVDGLVAALPDLIEYGPTIIKNLADIINENVPKLIIAGANIILKLIDGIIENIPNLIAHFPEMVKAIISVIGAVNWVGLGKSIITGIANGIKNLANTIPEHAKNIATNAFNRFKSTNWLSLGRDLITKIVSGITGLISKIPTALANIGRNAMTAFTKLGWKSIGKNIISGIASGISGAAGEIASAARRAAENALSAAKKLLGIASPSKRARKEVGQMYGKGLELGILDEADAVGKASDVLAEKAVKEIDAPDYTAIALRARNSVLTSTAAMGQKIVDADGNNPKESGGNIDYDKLKSMFKEVMERLNLKVVLDKDRVGYVLAPTMDSRMSDIEELKERGC